MNADTPRWFSASPGKAAAEKLFLLHTPVWMAVMGGSVLLGLAGSLGDVGLLALSILVAAPFLLLPAFLGRGKEGPPWYKTYWFKANLYIAVFSFVGGYFGTEYFFDVLGMYYRFPKIRLNLDSALLGSGGQRVPLAMYFFTHAYFMTYHTTAVVVLRRIKSSRLPAKSILFPLAVVAVGYSWAWIETFVMATPLMAEIFGYTDKGRMLAFGSLLYALYFVASFPIYFFLDERQEGPWSPMRVTAAALSAGMLTLILLDVATHIVGTFS